MALPWIFDRLRGVTNQSVVLVVSPLVALMADQVAQCCPCAVARYVMLCQCGCRLRNQTFLGNKSPHAQVPRRRGSARLGHSTLPGRRTDTGFTVLIARTDCIQRTTVNPRITQVKLLCTSSKCTTASTSHLTVNGLQLFVSISLRVVRNDSHNCSLELCDIFEGKDKHEQINTVLIEGAPGIGKTATSLTICKEWTSGRHFQFFDMLIFWSLKDPALQHLCSLDELFFHDSGEVSQSVAQRVMIESGKGVLFIFDGWDELPSSVSRARNHCLFDIIRGKRLPFASVVVTTRSVESQHLLQKTMFDRRIDICGFSSVSIQKYIHRCFLGTPERAS